MIGSLYFNIKSHVIGRYLKGSDITQLMPKSFCLLISAEPLLNIFIFEKYSSLSLGLCKWQNDFCKLFFVDS